MAGERRTRPQVASTETWNLDDLFPGESAWEAELTQISTDLSSVEAYAGRLHEGPRVLNDCLDAYEKISIRLMRVVTYANLRFSEDGSSSLNQGLLTRAGALNARVAEACSFIAPELLKLPDGTVEAWLEETPGLQAYRQLLADILRRRPHVLPADAEAVVAAFNDVLAAPYMIYSHGKSSDMRFRSITATRGQTVPVSIARYQHSLELSYDAHIRREAYRSFVEGLRGHQAVFAATFSTEIRKNIVLARLRNYPSAIDMLLEPHRISADVYHRVLDVLYEHLAPHMRRLARLRRRLYEAESLLVCDLKAPFDTDAEPTVTFDDAAAMITAALDPLGAEYGSFVRGAFAGRWIDRADNVGKATGAFCRHAYGVHPYVLVTWFDTLRSAFVLVHELGHAGQVWLATRSQPLFSSSPPTFFSEAPSTLNELLLGHHLLSTVNDTRVRRRVLAQVLATYQHNFSTHLLEAHLQRRMYELADRGQPITAERLNEETGRILGDFWRDTVEIDEGARLTWMRQPHYYFGLNPSTYAVGLTVSTIVAERIRNDGAPAVDRWLQALKSGGTLEPSELLKLVDVDLSTPEPLLGAADYVGRLADDLERAYQYHSPEFQLM